MSVRDVIMAKNADSMRLDRVVRASILSAMGHIINGTVCTIYLWGRVEPVGLLAVYGGFLMVGAMLLYGGLRMKSPKNRILSARAVRLVTISAFISGLPWGVFGLYTILAVPDAAKMVPYGVLGGMAAGGTLVLAQIPVASFVYLATTIMPLIIANPLLSAGNEWLFSICLGFYAVTLGYFSLSNARNVTHSEINERLLTKNMAELTEAHTTNAILAKSDPLTGLPNRRDFSDRLAIALSHVDPQRMDVALPVYLVDLDHFKTVNDTFGHDFGDMYLKESAVRLVQAVPSGWTVSRLGGDEFAIIPMQPIPERDVERHGQALVRALNGAMNVLGRTIKSAGSVAAAYAPHHTLDARELLVYADDALTTAKSSGRGRFTLFDIEARTRRHLRDVDSEFLRPDILAKGLVMTYQPQFHLLSKQLVGFETLVRWNHPRGGMVGPDYLLDLAEEKGVILDVCEEIFAKVAADIQAWRNQGLMFGRIAVNVHQAQLLHPEHLFISAAALGQAAGGNHFITLEVTENTIIGRGTEEVRRVLDHLVHSGFKIALDDFGTGYSSLTHLTDLPISELKIDRHFVQGITSKLNNYAVVKSVYDMARILGIDIVAEGIETLEQEQTIMALGQMIGQGYLYGRPMLFADALALLEQRQPQPGEHGATAWAG